MSSSEIETQAQQFAERYAALFSSPDACNTDKLSDLANKISKFYRPGVTFFTNGQISRFDNQSRAAQLIATEMQSNITSGLGTCLLLQNVETRAYSDTAATCWLEWNFRPQAGSEFEGRGWTFSCQYGFRMGDGNVPEGWEYVVRDREVEAMREATGMVFNQ